jgi:hypothetical protein
LQTVACGKEGNGNRVNTVTINFAFTDRWSYEAHVSTACAATLSYTATDPKAATLWLGRGVRRVPARMRASPPGKAAPRYFWYTLT